MKARYGPISRGTRIAASLGAVGAGSLYQRDTFVLQGIRRLKVREETGNAPELIYYGRLDTGTRAGRESRFIRIPLRDTRTIIGAEHWNAADRIVVVKRRRLYLYKNARLHLDSVKGLGNFIEFEVLMTQGRAQARGLIAVLVSAFGILTKDIVAGAYADLLRQRLQR